LFLLFKEKQRNPCVRDFSDRKENRIDGNAGGRQAAQQAFADDADRRGEDGTAVQPGAGSASLFLDVKPLFRL
jgi:hypothetical protein